MNRLRDARGPRATCARPLTLLPRALPAVLTALALLLPAALLPTAARAGSYAALDEVPPGAGELRLVEPGSHVDPSGRALLGFPLKHTFVDARIDGPVAEVLVEQTFTNPFDHPIEAVYVFPLDDDAAVHAYAIRVGERVIEGRIAERGEARQIYEDARDAGHTAGLLEQEKPDVFVQSVANIAPGEEITVSFRYVAPLDYTHEEGWRFHFPTTISPRYVSPDALDPRTVGGGGGAAGAVTVPYAEDIDADVEILVRADLGVPVRHVESPSHDIDVDVSDTRARIALAGGTTAPDRDFVLRLRGAGEQTLLGAVTHRDAELGGYFTLVVQPKLQYAEGDLTPREVVLLVDVSGSMQGAPIDRAREVAAGLLATLRPEDTFNVLTFASGTDHFARAPVAASVSRVADATRFVRALGANGGTELDDGLREAVQGTPAEGRVRLVFLLTDGGIGYDDDVLAIAQRADAVNRVFPVGIGDAPNRSLLDRLAEQARGFASYLDLREDPAALVEILARRTEWPYLTDLSVDWGDLAVQDVVPARLPDVYAGLPVVISGRYARPGSGEVVLRGRRAGRTFALPLQVTLPEAEDRPAVPLLWAQRQIRSLLARQYGGEVPAVVAEITRLGLKFGLVTPYTSYVAVDEERVVAGTPTTVAQPNQRPSGYGGGSSSGGGSSWGLGGGGGGGDVDPSMIALALLAAAAGWRRRRA